MCHDRVGTLLEAGTGFHLELTCSENIFFNGGVLAMTRAEIRRRFVGRDWTGYTVGDADCGTSTSREPTATTTLGQ